MNGFIKSTLAILTAFVLCLTINATQTLAQEQTISTRELKDSPRKTPPMPNSPETRCLTVTDCDRLIQALVVELWKETAISQKAEKSVEEIVRERDELRIDRDKWRQLYAEEKEAGSKFAANNLSLTAAFDKYKSDAELSNTLISEQNKKIRRLKIQRFVFGGISFGAGFGVGYIAK